MRTHLLIAMVVVTAGSLARAEGSTAPAGTAPWGENAAWMNGEQRPAPTLSFGPATFSLYLDTYYAFDVNNPVDHTSFFNSVAPRHNEIGLNLASVAMSISSETGAYARLALQYGETAAATIGRDYTFNRGFELSHSTLDAVREAAAGWHFSGANIEAGILPGYLAPDSYLPGENWYLSRPLLADFLPRYLMAIRVQFPMEHSDFEIWFSNGWQVIGEYHGSTEGPTSKKDNLEYGSYGTYWNWRPTSRISLSDATWASASSQADSGSIRVFNAASAQAQYLRQEGLIRSGAISLVADVGYEHRHNADSGAMAGVILAHRLELGKVGWTVRADYDYDATQALVVPLPTGAPLAPGVFKGFGVGTTIDFKPSTNLLLRVEYDYRATNIPYESGVYGITGPGGFPGSDGTTPDLVKSDQRAIADLTVMF